MIARTAQLSNSVNFWPKPKRNRILSEALYQTILNRNLKNLKNTTYFNLPSMINSDSVKIEVKATVTVM